MVYLNPCYGLIHSAPLHRAAGLNNKGGDTMKKENTNWFELILALMDKAYKEGHSELGRELANVAYNYTPEVR